MLLSKMNAKQAGFTLLELMVTIALLAVLIGFAVPNFQAFIRSSRMSGAANDVITDFNLARSEAVKRRVPVTLCKSQDGTTCDADATAAFRSWIIFVDDADPAVAAGTDGNGVVNTGELILRQRTIANTLTVRSNTNARQAIFLATGFPNPTAAGNVTSLILCDDRGNATGVGGGSAARAINIAPTGRPQVTRDKTKIASLITSLGVSCP